MGAAVKMILFPDPVADDPRSARLANRGKRVDRALEGVEGVSRSVHYDLERSLVVDFVTDLASSHNVLLAPRPPIDT